MYSPVSVEDLDKYKGTLKGKIAAMPSTATYAPTFKALATRYTDEELKEMTTESMAGAAADAVLRGLFSDPVNAVSGPQQNGVSHDCRGGVHLAR